MEQAKEYRLLSVKDVIKTEESRINYLRGLIRIAESDDNKSSVEEDFIYRIAEILGASYSDIWQADDHDNDERGIIRFATKQEKTLFLMQAMYMCWLDDDYSDAEHKEIRTIGSELELDSADIEKIESWVKNGLKWLSAGAELLELE